MHLDWTRFIGSSSFDQGFGAVATKDKGIVFTGVTQGSNNGDIPYILPDSSIGNGENLLIGKLDSNKQLSWLKLYGGSLDDRGWRVIQTADDGLAVVGATFSSDRDVSNNHGYSPAIWLLKLDAQGNKLWDHCYGGPASDQPSSFAETPDKGYIILGTTNGPGGDVPFTYSTSPFLQDWILIKTDSAGNKQWSKTIGGTEEEYPATIVISGDGFYVIGGSESKNYECTSDTSWHIGTSSSADFYIIKFDYSGSLIWSKSYGGTRADIVTDAIWDNADSTLVVTGYSNSHDKMVGVNPQNTINSLDMWVMKTDANGNYKWGRLLGDNCDETFSMSIHTKPQGGYLAVCRSELNGPLPPTHVGHDDMWFFSLDKNGNVETDKVMGGTEYDYPYAIVPFKNSFCVVGTTISHQFSEGIQLTPYHGPASDIYISGIDEWPTIVPQTNANTGHLLLYPNPATNKLTIHLPTQASCQVIITDAIGRTVHQTIATGQVTVSITGWAKGIYFVQARDENGYVQVEKVMVQ